MRRILFFEGLSLLCLFASIHCGGSEIIQGEKGEKGEPGPRGEPGIPGERGEPGQSTVRLPNVRLKDSLYVVQSVPEAFEGQGKSKRECNEEADVEIVLTGGCIVEEGAVLTASYPYFPVQMKAHSAWICEATGQGRVSSIAVCTK